MKTYIRTHPKRGSTITLTRQVKPSIGNASTPTYSSYGGDSYMEGRGSANYVLRINPDTHLALYKAEQASPRNSVSIAVGSVLGDESITSVVGNRSAMNNVHHRKIGVVNYPIGLMVAATPQGGHPNWTDYMRYATTSGYALYLGDLAREMQRDYEVGADQQFSARAFWSMRPKFEGKVSLINSLFELKDFKDILAPIKILRRFNKVASSPLFSAYGKQLKQLAKSQNVRAKLHEWGVKGPDGLNLNALQHLARDISGGAAAAVLSLNLAIKPTIADAMAIMANLACSAEEAQRAFAASGDDGSLSHFGETTVLSLPTRLGGSKFFLGEGTHVQVKRTATMRSWYSYKLRSHNDTLREYWGMTGTVENFWQMLPLSFVLDYVLTIGKAMKYMERDNNVQNLAVEYCESVKLHLSRGMHILQDSAVYALIIDGVTMPPRTNVLPHIIAGTKCTWYTRKVMEPYKGPALPKLKLPSTTQSVNLLALVRVFTQ